MTAKQYPEAKKRWAKKNKEKVKHNNYRCMARTFLKEMANREELAEMQEVINKRYVYLDKNEQEEKGEN